MLPILPFFFLFCLPLVRSEDHSVSRVGHKFVRHGTIRPSITHQIGTVSNGHLSQKPTYNAIHKGFMHNQLVLNMLQLMEDEDSSSNLNKFLHIIFSTIAVIGSVTLFCLSMWQASKLFSQGMWSQKFFKGGGYWLILAAFIGALIGVCLSFALGIHYICYFLSGCLLVGASVVYIGRRGAILGITGGAIIGITLGSVHRGSIGASIVEGIICTAAGVSIGFLPIFPNLKINARYIQQGLRSSSLLTNGNIA